jgi:hypothetical protein
MPVIFPSHQGLILPLWRRFPGRIDGVALCVGAALPDIVDAIAWPFRGELGQWLGHSLLGVVVSVPVGLTLVWILRRASPPRLLSRLDQPSSSPSTIGRACISIGLGSLSHVLFDLVTHGNLRLLWPWYANDHAFPSWWYHTWGEIPLPFYREPYPFAPHTVAWILLTIIGAVLFVRCLRRLPDPRDSLS